MEPGGDYREELVARERSGHTAVVEGNFLYVWGGYVVRKRRVKCYRIASAISTTVTELKAE